MFSPLTELIEMKADETATGRIAILGAGNIGQALALGWSVDGVRRAADIALTRRRLDTLQRFADTGFPVSSDNRSAAAGADGTHPQMADLVLRRAISTCRLTAEARRSVALVVIGHGTERNATSGDTVYRLVAALRARNEFGAVHGGFLDEEPRIGSMLASLGSASVVLVPFLIAEGWHSKTTIPQELELQGTHTTRGGMSIWYTPPVGTLPEVADVILQLAGEAGAGTSAPGAAAARV